MLISYTLGASKPAYARRVRVFWERFRQTFFQRYDGAEQRYRQYQQAARKIVMAARAGQDEAGLQQRAFAALIEPFGKRLDPHEFNDVERELREFVRAETKRYRVAVPTVPDHEKARRQVKPDHRPLRQRLGAAA